MGQTPNPSSIIGQFIKHYSPTQSGAADQAMPTAEMKPLEAYPQVIVQSITKFQKSKDAASSHKTLLDLGEDLLVYLTDILFGGYRKSWPLDEDYYSLNPYVKAGLDELIANLVILTGYQPILINV